MIKNDEYYMQKAISLAKKAYKKDEVPVGALLVKDNEIIATSYNLKESHNNATHHAEILALNKLEDELKNIPLIITIPSSNSPVPPSSASKLSEAYQAPS